MSHDALRERAEVMAGASALHHLFAVTSGLESIAVGEEEIAGQVRRAYESARGARATTPELDTAFQRAAKVSRDVRAATAVGKAGRSLVQFALQLAGTRVTDWRQTRALIVGTGNYAATTVAALRTLGVSELAVFSLTGRAEQFAAKYSLRPEHDLRDAVASAEVVITCTNRYSVTVDDIPDESRRTIIDLGLPRNVDPAVGRLPGVELMDLELIATHARLPMLAPDAQHASSSPRRPAPSPPSRSPRRRSWPCVATCSMPSTANCPPRVEVCLSRAVRRRDRSPPPFRRCAAARSDPACA
jgi:glutamyl-tRNA reductase